MPARDDGGRLADVLRLGLLAREAAGPDETAECLRLALATVGGDAACLVTAGLDGVHRRVAVLDYPDAVERCLVEDFTSSPWQAMVVGSPLPPSISTEPGQSFRRGWIYEDVMAPAGFRDGVSAALHRDGRYVGAIHVSSTDRAAYDDDRRAVLASLGPALAVLTDPVPAVLPAVLPAARAAGEAAACLLGPEGPTPLPGRRRPAVADDPRVRGLADALGALGARMDFLWPLPGPRASGRGWVRCDLDARPGAHPAGPGGAVLCERSAVVPFGLSARELEVLTRIALGWGNDEIAASLIVSPRTVHTHVERVLAKTGSRSRTQAAALAVARRLLRPDAELLRADRAGILLTA